MIPQLKNTITCKQGNMSEVQAGEHPDYGRVVLKSITPRLEGVPRFESRWSQEILISSLLSLHTNVPKVFEYGVIPKPWYLQEWIGIKSLRDWMNSREYPLKANDLITAKNIIDKLFEIIHISSSFGIIHRDITPENIILNSLNVPFIVDWGLATYVGEKLKIEKNLYLNNIRNIGENRLTEEWRRHGRPGYAPPEQANAFYDKASIKNDIYSIVVIALEMLSGQIVFDKPGLNSLEVITMQQNIYTLNDLEPWIIEICGHEILNFLIGDPEKRSIDIDYVIILLKEVIECLMRKSA
ncbi:serine/threonine protein kinase [Paenibacillus glucanolyticus]|uniref:serine/threonine protein kinase n=1 Tax=Paenibacillus glucanolyticus TaxID=59843 RepID=UPI00096CD532|nr:protein kinase [Paenibacillus glucanolyticus]OMF81580.1 hypothetical protein BK142_03640 [Paenibacillus glucanolyticus]